jgi:transcriptional regulator with XRE-family HTH domain
MEQCSVWISKLFFVQMETFSHRLVFEMKRYGLTRRDLGDKTGIGMSAIAKWINGKLLPKSEQLLKLARVLDVQMEWLLTGEGRKERERADSRTGSTQRKTPSSRELALMAEILRLREELQRIYQSCALALRSDTQLANVEGYSFQQGSVMIAENDDQSYEKKDDNDDNGGRSSGCEGAGKNR